MDSSEELLESVSPNGDVVARVEQDDVACFFYLQGETKEFGTKSCWVRNLGAAPEQFDGARMREGLPPALPRRFCRHPAGGPPLVATELDVIWAEEGSSAALRENGELLAVIPLWSGRDGFHGYARDCVGESPLCWPLGTPETNVQFERYRRAEEFWRSWDEGSGPWPAIQSATCDAMERALGAHSNYYAIDGGQWPPKAMLRIPRGNDVFLVTVGMALRPQPGVELHYKDPSPYRRIELGVRIDAALGDAAIKRVAGYLSAQSGFPWSRQTFLGDGHTMPADTFGELSRGAFSCALLQKAQTETPRVKLPAFRGDPVTLLWMTPITEREQLFAEEHGSAALADKLASAKVGQSTLGRRPAV